MDTSTFTHFCRAKREDVLQHLAPRGLILIPDSVDVEISRGRERGYDLPDIDSLQADACGPGYHYNTNSYLLIESKEHMRDIRKLRSPDEWDAVALTFAEPVAERRKPAPAARVGGWMS